RRGTAGRRSAAPSAWRRTRGCRRCPRGPPAGSRGSCFGRRGRSRAARRGMPRSSVAPGVVDVEGVELARGAVAAELARVDALHAGRGQKLCDLAAMLVLELLLDAVGTQALDRAADVETSLVDR